MEVSVVFHINYKTGKVTVHLIPFELSKAEIVIEGKRRDRKTKSGYWTDNVKEVQDWMFDNHNSKTYALSKQLAELEQQYAEAKQKFINDVQEANNSWLD